MSSSHNFGFLTPGENHDAGKSFQVFRWLIVLSVRNFVSTITLIFIYALQHFWRDCIKYCQQLSYIYTCIVCIHMLGLWDYLSDSCYFDAYIYVSENIGKATERQYCLWLSFIIFRVICILEWGLATNSHKIVIAFFLWRIENYFEYFFEIN